MDYSKKNLISVDEAERIIFAESRDFGFETVSLPKSLGRTLAKPLVANRDFPPFHRVTMDGIAIKYKDFEKGNRKFTINSIQVAGEPQKSLIADNECIEVMTGAILPKNTDTIIRYEDLSIANGIAKINSEMKFQQNIHFKGEDRKIGDILVPENQIIRAAELAVGASIGASLLSLKKLPKIAIITSGDELVGLDQIPKEHQIYSSNVFAINSLLNSYGIEASKIHIQDNLSETEKAIENALNNYDILIMSGGVSMGKRDFIPTALHNLGVEKLFHKIAQTPGKPFWFGKKAEKLVFALPGNPVSTYLCMVRYMMPWLFKALNNCELTTKYAQLSEDFTIKNSLTYFLQVKLFQEKATIMAQPIKGHGSGDFANLVDANAFLELPAYDRNEFKKGEIFRVWRF
jgi:molybdopterin molybdotransferase